MIAVPDLAFRPITELRAALDASRVSSRDLVEACLDRIDRLNETAKAFIHVAADGARAAADRADAARAQESGVGPLCGIPFAVKDLIDIAGLPTTGGSRVLHDNVAEADATLIDRMAGAGAVCLGKTNLHEFAYGATGENETYGTAVNAYDHSRLAGGSSSGSAAAVAFGMVPAAFGTDTGGSARVPAALSGLVGLKPTLGRVSTTGVLPYCWTLDHVGLLTRTVRDAALLLSVVAGYDDADPACADTPVDDYVAALDRDLAGLTVGVPGAFYYDNCDGEILAASEQVLQFLEGRGARIVPCTLPSMEHARSVSLTIQMPETLSFHARYLEERGDLYGADFRAGMALGQCLLAEHYVRARRMLTVYRRETDAAFAEVDVIVTPATPVVAPAVGTVQLTTGGLTEAVGNAITRYTTFFNMSGHPAVTVPSGLHGSGLPMGVQVVGRYFDEATVLAVAAAIEGAPRFQIPPPAIP